MSQLRVYGSGIASRQNIDNWIDRAIAPKSDADFRAVLRLAGMENKLEPLIVIAKKVKEARQSGAHEVRHLMNRRLEHADLQVLKESGVQQIDLLDVGIPQYTAVRIIEVAANRSLHQHRNYGNRHHFPGNIIFRSQSIS